MIQRKWGARLGMAVLGAGMWLAGGPALSQPTGTMPTGTTGPESSVDTLSRNLRTLAANPRSMPALMGAGQAALRLGDAQAALTFFARAEELAPRDGRIKMWMGSALVQLEQARGALKFFKDATDLGVADSEVARDRGLAYDISGDPRRAQRDYRLALQAGPDFEVTRRLALSLAITGERDAALRLLDPQIASGDRAAERTRALVLALVGDLAGAGRVVEASMPGGQGQAMMPFLARLPSLSYADRALAVHLGHFPKDGRTASPSVYAANRASQPDAAARSASIGSPTDAGRPDPAQELLQRRIAGVQRPLPQASAAPARAAATATAPSRPAGSAAPGVHKERGLAPPVSAWSWSRGIEPIRPQPVHPAPRTAAAQPQPKPRETAAPTGARGAAQLPAGPRRDPTPIITARSDPAPRDTPAPASSSSSSSPAPSGATPHSTPVAVVAAADPTPLKASPREAVPQPSQAAEDLRNSSRLADLAATVAKIAEAPAAPAVSRKSAAAAAPTAKPAAGEAKGAVKASVKTEAAGTKAGRTPVAAAPAKPAPAKKPEAAPKEPSRIWVQVAGGSDRAAFPGEFARLKAKAPKLLAGRGAWAAKLNATNRLLVGPFADAEAAQEFVNALRKAELSAFAWTSETGEKVEKLPGK